LNATYNALALAAAEGDVQAIDRRATAAEQLEELRSELFLLESAKPAAIERERGRLERDEARIVDTLMNGFDNAEADVNSQLQYVSALATVRPDDLEPLRAAGRALQQLAGRLAGVVPIHARPNSRRLHSATCSSNNALSGTTAQKPIAERSTA
jgi:hypothetical protein